ncbi:MAG TPA: RloB family protein [Leptospiraceae bacterium]|nr:RloB family protein [Leptospiraceae bacterium]HMY66893.1 RloB family protein [Leptospiraceae bacterium]HNF14628.1 RloB family protein [Leptospiraceae bacterium]HNH07669.1 RloB family protein [Leptospiraceae bacterium]HNI96676.1 RloB family protein [Leptospiraceae bacterium]
MILRDRLFERNPPERDAKKIYIFCEGRKREYQYFEYFEEIDSRINIIIYKLHPEENNSPNGLLKIAETCLIPSEENPEPEFFKDMNQEDEVWLVFDVDPDKSNSRFPQILNVRQKCKEYGWNTALSNPCFEVWLYFHFFAEKPEMPDLNKCNSWKNHIDKKLPGGFNSKKHPLFIEQAVVNAKQNFSLEGSFPVVGSTEMHYLGKTIYTLLKKKLNLAKTSAIPQNP